MTLEIVPSTAARRPRASLAHPQSMLVPRPRLVRRLIAASDLPVALIEAPAGYGKTTLLREWIQRDARPAVWLEAGEVAPLAELAADGPAIGIIDDAHRHERLQEAVDLVTRLPGSTLALASRRPLPIHAGRLRAHRLVVTLDARDLAMTRLESAMLLDAVGAELSSADADELTARTEGWPAVLYLAALGGPDAEAFSGADRTIADYLHAELFADRTEDELAFMRRASVLPRLSGPLCDAVLRRRGSAAQLDALSRLDAGLMPLDRYGVEYRFHRVVREALRSELERFEPELTISLHRRAAAWHSRHDEPEAGIEHALACHDAAATGRMLWSLLPAYAGAGQSDVLLAWLNRFRERERAAEPRLALASGICELARGHRASAERWLEAAAIRSTPEAAAGLRACTRPGSLEQLRADAAQALAGPFPAAGRYLQGVAELLGGEVAQARQTLERVGVDCGDQAPPAAALCHAQIAVLAVEEGDWESAQEWTERAETALARAPHVGPAIAALPHAVCAEIAAQAGDLAGARAHAVTSSHALDALGDFVGWYVAQTQIWLARAHLRLSDARAARVLLARAARHSARIPDAPMLAGWLHATWERADAFAAASGGDGPQLTKAELRVLRFMPSHLSFREIGTRLHVSTNTVKTQAVSVYRKLDVSCRSEAVTRGRSVGLIEG